MHKLIAPLAAAGAVLVGATLFIRSRRTDTSEPYEEVLTIHRPASAASKTDSITRPQSPLPLTLNLAAA